jgi:hypothetical protein
MALISPGSLCVLCSQPLSDPIFATSGMFLPLDDPLAFYCDAAMHWHCYAVWEHRERFAKAYVLSKIENEKENPYWARVFENEHCFIQINPEPLVAQAHIMLCAMGSTIAVPLQEWDKWIWQKGPSLAHHSFEEDALKVALPAIRMTFPGLRALLQAADWSRKERLKEETYLREQKRLERVADYNQRCEELKELLDSDGLVCPHCHHKTKKIRYFDKSPQSRSYFVCQLCARSFRAEDIVKRVH